MNHRIAPTSVLSPLVLVCRDICESRGLKILNRDYELEDTVLRCGGYAWDIGSEAAPLHAEIAQLVAAKKAADEAAEAARIAEELANPTPYLVSRDLIWQRVKAAIGDANAYAVIKGFTEDQKIEWYSNENFRSNNVAVRGLCAALGLDADLILARDGP